MTEETRTEGGAIFASPSSETTTSGAGACIEGEFDMSDSKIINRQKIVIGIIGKAGSGKDTVGEFLEDKYGLKRMSYAEPLKIAVQYVFAIDDDYMFDREKREMPLPNWPEKDWSTRKLLQLCGTDIFRDQFDEDIWVKNLVCRVKRAGAVVITDVRFPNEVETTKKLLEEDGYEVYFVRINRPNHVDAQGGIQGHPSEIHIDNLKADFDIANDGELEDLYEKIDTLAESLLSKKE